jgi:hypothetical protein
VLAFVFVNTHVSRRPAVNCRRAVAAILLGCVLPLSAAGAPAQRGILDLGNQTVDPFHAAADATAIVFLFVAVDCPISNRYAPEIQRLQRAYESRGVVFSLVYANPAELPADIRRHVAEFGHSARVLRDPMHALVKLTNATVAPEVAVYDSKRRLVYRGRVDDRYLRIGLERPAATTHDLEDALSAVIAGQPVRQPRTQAVGCYLADFLR